jgi:hypothetical protein
MVAIRAQFPAIDRQPFATPGIHAARERPHAPITSLLETACHDGRRGVVRAVAIDDDLVVAVERELRNVAYLDAARDPAGLCSALRRPDIEHRGRRTGPKEQVQLPRGDPRHADRREEAMTLPPFAGDEECERGAENDQRVVSKSLELT